VHFGHNVSNVQIDDAKMARKFSQKAKQTTFFLVLQIEPSRRHDPSFHPSSVDIPCRNVGDDAPVEFGNPVRFPA